MSQRKAISPIIAIIIILLITIALAGAGYSYISVYWTGLLNKQIQVLSSTCLPENQGKITIRNIGTSEINTSEIRVLDARTGADISQDVLWSSNVSSLGLVLELRFDEGSGTTAVDSSGNGNDGTLGNGACTPGSGTCPTWANGNIGGALSFDGANDFVETSFTLPSEISVLFWATTPAISGCCDHPFGLGAISELTVFYDSGNNINYKFGATQSVFGTFEFDKWDHIALIYDGVQITGYVNGNPGTPAAASITITTDNVVVGDNSIGGGDYFQGKIDEFRIYNRALSPGEINEIAGNSVALQPGKTTVLTHTCPGTCSYSLVLPSGAKEAMLAC